jgi:hypothetical protein
MPMTGNGSTGGSALSFGVGVPFPYRQGRALGQVSLDCLVHVRPAPRRCALRLFQPGLWRPSGGKCCPSVDPPLRLDAQVSRVQVSLCGIAPIHVREPVRRVVRDVLCG